MTARYGLPDPQAPLLNVQPLLLPNRTVMILEEMIAKPEGITSIDYPGVRVADAVLKLRKAGVDVQTIHEPHGGEFAGHHARYILISRVVRLAEAGASTPVVDQPKTETGQRTQAGAA